MASRHSKQQQQKVNPVLLATSAAVALVVVMVVVVISLVGGGGQGLVPAGLEPAHPQPQVVDGQGGEEQVDQQRRHNDDQHNQNGTQQIGLAAAGGRPFAAPSGGGPADLCTALQRLFLLAEGAALVLSLIHI